MIRVALVIGRLNVGGAEAELVRLANGLDRARFQPFVVTVQDSGPLAERLRDVELVELGRRRKWTPGSFRALCGLLRARKPHVVQSFLFAENVMCRLAGEGAVVSAIQGSLSDDCETGTPSLRLWLERRTFGRARAVVSNSAYYRDLYGRLGFDAGRIEVIRSAVEPVAASGGGAAVRREFGVPEGRLLVTCVARLVERKGHEDLLKAAAGRYALLFVGDGPLRGRLEGRGAILAGTRRDVPEILAASDVVVLASRFGEGCPNAALEAMAAGRPVVATRAGGTPEVVRDGETGILVPPGDTGALRAALERLEREPGLRERMGRAGRALALSDFGVERMVKLYEDLYFRLTGGGAPI